MKKTYIVFILMIATLIVVVNRELSSQIYLNAKKNILVVHSYSPDKERTHKINKGLIAGFDSINLSESVLLGYEYLGDGLNSKEEIYATMTKLFEQKYKTTPIEAIVAVDNFAFDFLATQQVKIWGNRDIPVVFCGVNGFELSMIDSLSNFVGIGETIKYKLNIDMIRSLQHDVENVYIILDSTSVTGMPLHEEIQKYIHKMPRSWSNGINVVTDLSPNNIIQLFNEMPQNSAVLLLLDNSGSTKKISTKQLFQLSQDANIPVWSPLKSIIDKGVVLGGYFTDPEDDGMIISNIIKQIFDGNSPIRIIPEEPVKRYYFDMTTMGKYGISYNDVESFTDKYIEINSTSDDAPMFMYAILVICGLALFLVIVIIFLNAKRKKQFFTNDWCSLADSIPDVVFAMNDKGQYLYLSDSAEEQLGMIPANIIGKTAKEAGLPRHVVKSDHEIILPMFKNKTPQKNEYDLTIDGEKKYFETRYSPVKNNFGEIIYVLGVIRNISQRKEVEIELKASQERFKITMQAVNDGMWEWYPVSNDVFFSDRWYTIMGYQPGELPEKFATWVSLFHSEDQEEAIKSLNKYAMTGDSFKLLFRMGHKNGSYVWIEARGRTVEWTEEGHPKRLVGTNSDVTLRVQAHEEIRIAKETAENADRLKTFFLSNMSHEIRTPMNQIIGFAKLLIRDGLSQEEKNDFSNVINRHAKQLISLIDSIIDISKIESGQIDANKAFYSFNGVLSDLFIMFRSELVSEGKADIRLKYSKKLLDSQALLLNDELRFTQVLTNLLNNAIKFTDAGEIEFGYEYPKDSEIVFFVRDTGIGIPESKFESIFELFRQGDGSFTRKYGGTGLGLSISKRLAVLMGGNVWVESTEGKGSTFYFKLPYDESVVEMFSNDDDDIKVIDSLDLSQKTILVVDDTIDVINYLQILLKNTKVNFLFATSGKEAIELYKEKQDIIDLILMDIQMPEMDGMEVTRRIKKINNEVIIVAQTAFAFETEKELFMQAGCNDFVAKPIEDDRLIDIFQKHLFK